MEKIPTIFLRDPDNLKHVLPEPRPGCEWVFNGEGRATRKWDGTAVLITEDGRIFKRRAVRAGQPWPEGFFEAEHRLEDDEIKDRRKIEGWVPVREDDPADQWHRKALENMGGDLPPGTYELIGPKIQGNPEKWHRHELVPHGVHAEMQVPTDFSELREWLETYPGEGIVWHHPDGRMAKIKRRDFF